MTAICAICVDNVAGFVLEVATDYASTGEVPACWPCVSTRLPELVDDLLATYVGRRPVHWANVTDLHVRRLQAAGRARLGSAIKADDR
jgi:hypothetical protein